MGQNVRYDGGHKRDSFIMEVLARFVEWVPVCPEVEVGMGVPRETVRLIGSPSGPRMVAEQSGKDWTREMQDYSRKRLSELKKISLSGYILKRNSPSCGMERVKVYGRSGAANRGQGLFARLLMDEMPLLPVEEEARLNNLSLRENFIERVFAYDRWQAFMSGRKSARSLFKFHIRHRLTVMAHSQKHLRRLGRLVAASKIRPLREVCGEYGRLFMEAMAIRATVRGHAEVLRHIVRVFSRQLDAEERKELLGIIKEYHRGLLPLIAPVTLIRHYVKKYRLVSLADQLYLNPGPGELMLRNHG